MSFLLVLDMHKFPREPKIKFVCSKNVAAINLYGGPFFRYLILKKIRKQDNVHKYLDTAIYFTS